MLSAGVRGLVAGRAVADVEPVDEAQAVEHLECAIDAGDADPRLAGAQLVGDLLCRRAAVLPRQRVDDTGAGSSRAKALALQRRMRVLAPGGIVCVAHALMVAETHYRLRAFSLDARAAQPLR